MGIKHYMPVPMTVEQAQTLDALAVLTGKHKQLILSEIVQTELGRLEKMSVMGTSCTPDELRKRTIEALQRRCDGAP